MAPGSARKHRPKFNEQDAIEAAQAASLLEQAMSSFRNPLPDAPAPTLTPCRYRASCFDLSQAHRAKYSHPTAPACRYGAACKDHSLKHRAKYSHAAAAAAAASRIQALTRGKSDRRIMASAYFHSPNLGTSWDAYDATTNQLISSAMAARPAGGTVALPGGPFEVRWGSEATSSKMRKTVCSACGLEHASSRISPPAFTAAH